VLEPQANDIVGDGLTVAWAMSDADDDDLFANVLFSKDGGNTFTPLRTNITGTAVLLDGAELAGTSQGKIRVIVSDGVNTAQADSTGVFTTDNQSPSVQILSPNANATYALSQTVLLEGQATDAETDALPETAYAWASDVQGGLGNGPSLSTDALVPGLHLISLSVTDANGATTTAVREVSVSEALPQGEPALVVAPSNARFVAVAGNTELLTETLSVRDAAEGELTWTATTDAAWLSLEQTAGEAPSDVALQVNPTGLATGLYTGTVTLSASAVPSKTLQVVLQVQTPYRTYLPFVAR
jgi:hypothetical protein